MDHGWSPGACGEEGALPVQGLALSLWAQEQVRISGAGGLEWALRCLLCQGALSQLASLYNKG